MFKQKISMQFEFYVQPIASRFATVNVTRDDRQKTIDLI